MAWLTLNQAREYAHVRHDDIRRAIADGEISAYRRGTARNSPAMVCTDDIDAWVRTWPRYVPGPETGGGER